MLYQWQFQKSLAKWTFTYSALGLKNRPYEVWNSLSPKVTAPLMLFDSALFFFEVLNPKELTLLGFWKN